MDNKDVQPSVLASSKPSSGAAWRVAPVPMIVNYTEGAPGPFWGPGYRYDASVDQNSNAGYVYDDAPRLFSQRRVRSSVDFYRQRTGYRIGQ